MTIQGASAAAQNLNSVSKNIPVQKDNGGIAFNKFLDTALQNKELLSQQMQQISTLGKNISPQQIAQYAGQLVGNKEADKRNKINFDSDFKIKENGLQKHSEKFSGNLAQVVPDELNQLNFPDNFGAQDIEETSYSPINPTRPMLDRGATAILKPSEHIAGGFSLRQNCNSIWNANSVYASNAKYPLPSGTTTRIERATDIMGTAGFIGKYLDLIYSTLC